MIRFALRILLALARLAFRFPIAAGIVVAGLLAAASIVLAGPSASHPASLLNPWAACQYLAKAPANPHGPGLADSALTYLQAHMGDTTNDRVIKTVLGRIRAAMAAHDYTTAGSDLEFFQVTCHAFYGISVHGYTHPAAVT
jgi:hypothetical protein